MKTPPDEFVRSPSLEEAANLLMRAGADDGLWAHSTAVAAVSLRIAAGLVHSGVSLNMDAVAAGGLLHDIGKGSPDHAHVGARMVREHGFPAIAEIIAVHTDFIPVDNAPVSEAEVVFLADKLVRKNRCVSLEARFAEAATRFAADPDALAGVARRRNQAMRCRDHMAAVLKTAPEAIATLPSGHTLESHLDDVLRRLGKSSTLADIGWQTHLSFMASTKECP